MRFLHATVWHATPWRDVGRAHRVALSALVLVLCLSGCEWPGIGAKAAKEAAPEKKASRSFPVRVQAVTVMPLKYEVQALGSIEAQDVYQIHALVPGTLYDVTFNEGDTVASDKILCRIAPEAYRFMMLKAEGILENVKADLEHKRHKLTYEIKRTDAKYKEALHELARRQQVKAQGAISNEEILIYESRRDVAQIDNEDIVKSIDSEIKVLEASIKEKEAAFEIAKDDVRKSIVKPPIAGMIEKRGVTNGMFVTPGTLLATIVDRSALKLKFKLAEKDSAVVRSGMNVNFTVPAWPGRVFEARIFYVGNLLDQDTRTVDCYARVTVDPSHLFFGAWDFEHRCEACVAEEQLALKPGYFASVRMVTDGKLRAVVVPSTAVLPTEKGFVAYVVKDGKAEQRFVKTGMTVTDNSLEVLEGLKENEVLVMEGANALQNGSSVRVLNELPSMEPSKPEIGKTVSDARTPPAKVSE